MRLPEPVVHERRLQARDDVATPYTRVRVLQLDNLTSRDFASKPHSLLPNPVYESRKEGLVLRSGVCLHGWRRRKLCGQDAEYRRPPSISRGAS